MQWQLFDPADPPEWTTPEWYAGREAAPHLEQEGHRERLLLTAKLCEQAIGDGAKSAVDLGAGDGGLLSLLSIPSMSKWGYDLQPSNVEAARRRGVTVALTDISGGYRGVASLVIATELLEHLVDPHGLVRQLSTLRSTRFLVVSSPYTETGDSHYGYHTWAWDRAGYRRLLEDNGWRVIRQETAWISQVCLAVKQ